MISHAILLKIAEWIFVGIGNLYGKRIFLSIHLVVIVTEMDEIPLTPPHFLQMFSALLLPIFFWIPTLVAFLSSPTYLNVKRRSGISH
jgi:hypothetical protein